ncbi:Frag1/DRAM/Sfk1 family-domain-containing protein [Crepidotus variabilis]|uniref:Frag1/DRAM/Sfk1 family-domain-containing protein n=1 Tax=Crepidotus variabilis TaxID=179855 RepID=A0A9P6E6U9_9AGAR|nr:Frag1/DRAM/Sfk1 family-domain-containing protein [Crepidotus variabilis]
MAASEFSAASIARLHTVFATLAFVSTFVIGCTLHYKKIVKNDVAQYPDEWFPSVSATIGDWYPERNIFQILIALTSGPRFGLVFLQYHLHRTAKSSLPTIVFLFGLIRTLSCGGWVYVTSSDDHDVHDFMMVLYIVCNIPWMLFGTITTPIASTSIRKRRRQVSIAFFATLIPLVYFFVQHKIYRIPGAYTRYSFCEWGLILLDVLYDSITEQEFREAGLRISLGGPTTPESTLNKTLSQTEKNSSKLVQGIPLPPTADKAMTDAVDTALAPSQKTMLTEERVPETSSSTYRCSLSFLSDIYLAYTFWSLLTALIPTLFYFSVWELSIAGTELALFSLVSPVFLSIKFASPTSGVASNTPTMPKFKTLLDLVKTRRGQVLFQTISFIGIAAYAVPSPMGRLLLVAVASMAAMLRQSVLWAGIAQGEEDVGYQAIVTGLGIVIASWTKQANRSNNPIWPFINHKAGGWNKTGLVVGLLALYEYSTRPVPALKPVAQAPTIRQSSSTLLGALPFACLLFSIYNLLGDAGTLVAWSWTGYENGVPRGPLPHLHGSLTIVAMVAGSLLALWSITRQTRNPLSHPLWFAFGAASSYVMYAYRNWPGYLGGLGTATFLMSIIPLIFQKAATAASGTQGQLGVATTYGIAMFVYCIVSVLNVFTVAYAFVPGGVYLRERTDLILVFSTGCLSLAFNIPGLSQALVSRPPSRHLSTKFKNHIRTAFAALSVLTLLTTIYRLPRAPPTPFKPGPKIFTAGIWTVHFGIDNEGHDGQQGMMNLIKDMELDIVGLLETDLNRPAFGHRDLTRLMVEEMNYNVDLGPGPNQHTWGAVLLTKFPIISTKHHLLPSPHGELAPAIEAVLNIYGTEVTVVVSHNGQEEDPLDRELQSTELAKIMAASTRPVLFLGYVVTNPGAQRPHPYGILSNEGNVHDIDIEDADRWCEYIFYRGLYRTSYARLSRGIITDTELQVGQFMTPRHGHNVTDDSYEARYLRSPKEDLPEAHWMPMEYYGSAESGGVNGHFYHVFNTPLYYKLPEGALV